MERTLKENQKLIALSLFVNASIAYSNGDLWLATPGEAQLQIENGKLNAPIIGKFKNQDPAVVLGAVVDKRLNYTAKSDEKEYDIQARIDALTSAMSDLNSEFWGKFKGRSEARSLYMSVITDHINKSQMQVLSYDEKEEQGSFETTYRGIFDEAYSIAQKMVNAINTRESGADD